MGEPKACEHCGGPVTLTGRGRPRRYCSPSCRTAAWAARKDAAERRPPSVEDAVAVVLNSPTGTTEVLLGLAEQLRGGQRSGVANNQLIAALLTAHDAMVAVVLDANPTAGQSYSPAGDTA